MSRKFTLVMLATVACLATTLSAASEAMLTLKRAEQHALQNDPLLRKAIADIESAEADSDGAGLLPDPKVKLAAMNLPVDTFDLDQEAMTNLLVGVQQSFPAGSTLDIEKSTAEVWTRIRRFDIETVKKKVLRELRSEWLRVWAAQAKVALLAKQRKILAALLPSVKGAYRAGRGKQSHVSQIRLRIAQLKEEQYQLQGESDVGMAGLGQWGIKASMRLPAELPDELQFAPAGNIGAHPELETVMSRADISRYQIDLAEQRYKPVWGVEASYGWRDDRTNLLSMGVSMSIPFFAEKSLDARLAAKQKAYQAARESIQDVRTELETEKMRQESRLKSIAERINSYQSDILPELNTLQMLARAEYRSGRSDFSGTLEAEDALIKAQRDLLNLKIEQAENIIALRYLLEEMQS